MKRFSSQDVPSGPGVYLFRNSAGEVIYVGKAKSLRKRLATYFQPSRRVKAEPRVRSLINSIAGYEVFSVKSEAEALLLESRFIKEYAPRYNVLLRDDKRFLYVCVDTAEPFPRLVLTRLRKDDGRTYFGPFPRAGALRGTVDCLTKRFGLRTCRPRRPDESTRRHCLEHIVRSCSCPCVGRVTAQEYRERLDQLVRVLRGDVADVLDDLQRQMEKLAGRMRFEDAAKLRDIAENLKFVCAPGRTFVNATLDSGRPAAKDALAALQEALELPRLPEVIECFDISDIAGRLAVGSLVCFRSGRPSAKDYRRFKVNTPEGADDASRVREIVRRRYSRLVNEGRGLPDLIVVDGGRGQLNAALKALEAVDLSRVPVLGLAKKREEIYLPDREAPLVLPRHHEGLKLLQALRDESHRFALSYHRSLRRRRILNSLLADIEGVGPKRQEQLLRQFGSVRKLRKADPRAIADAVPHLGLNLARRIHDYLKRQSGTNAE